MIPGDYRGVNRVNSKGKKVLDKIIKSRSGEEYLVGKRIGQGGVAAVYKVKRLSDNKIFAFKEFKPDKNDIKLMRVHGDIRKNILRLLQNPVLDEKNNKYKVLVQPNEIVYLPASGGFGYVMDFVNTEDLRPVVKLWSTDYPGADVICEMGMNVAKFFMRLHVGSGWSYKDINEGNIYFNIKTGEMIIIDCDNISVPNMKTILGTTRYMAPEVYETETPDARTDQYSMAVLFYRMLVGGYPLDGKKVFDYLHSKNATYAEEAPVIYGKDALFAFNPNDESNTIRGYEDALRPEETMKYEIQTRMWDYLPDEIKNCFYKTFVEGLKETTKTKRASDKLWFDTFSELKKDGLVKCSCGKIAFGSDEMGKICPYCDGKLPVLPTKKKTPVPKKPAHNTTVQPKKPSKPTKANVKELTKVVFRVRRDIDPKILMATAERGAELIGRQIHPALPNKNIMRIEYNTKMNVLGAVNLSGEDWKIIEPDGTKKVVSPGKRVILVPGTCITVLYRQLELTVDSLS